MLFFTNYELNTGANVTATAAMSTSTSIATRNAAEEAVTKDVVTPITVANFNLERFRKFQRSIVNAARAVPSGIGGGAHEHVYLLEDDTTYTARTGGTGTPKPHTRATLTSSGDYQRPDHVARAVAP